jgi:hypothetical protein
MSTEKIIECLDKLVILPIELILQYSKASNGEMVSNNLRHNWLVVQPDNESDDDFTRLYNEIINLADSELITPQGIPAYAAHEILALSGYKVIRGESDSFGWLSGIILTPVGKIVYG